MDRIYNVVDMHDANDDDVEGLELWMFTLLP